MKDPITLSTKYGNFQITDVVQERDDIIVYFSGSFAAKSDMSAVTQAFEDAITTILDKVVVEGPADLKPQPEGVIASRDAV